MRRNLLNWCNLVSISKKLMFWVFGELRIFGRFVKKIMMKNAKLQFSEYLQNISKSKSFGKLVLIVFSDPLAVLLAINHQLIIMMISDQCPFLHTTYNNNTFSKGGGYPTEQNHVILSIFTYMSRTKTPPLASFLSSW